MTALSVTENYLLHIAPDKSNFLLKKTRHSFTPRKILPYNPKLKERARELRNKSTFTEVMLWNYLKNFQVRGFDFDRQRPIGNYIVDFYCKDLMLAIEIDGESHYFKEEKDKFRQRTIEGLCVKFLRFEDTDIYYISWMKL